ncbi:hypothetical protein F4680DRAFT_449286 [Xylaria scruposa]|nr:hypothetical protein F4680DRAFT_449286 [Xylaria scruposa]
MPLDEHGVPQIYDPRFVLFTKIEFLSIIFSPLSLGPTKLSIVCFYRRIFRGSKFSIVTSILLAVIASWAVAFFLARLLICVPVEAFWTQDSAARCFVPIPLFYTGAISDTIVDVIILSIPVPLVRKLNLPTKQKISVSLIFLLGAFEALGSVVVSEVTTSLELSSYHDIYAVRDNATPTPALDTALAQTSVSTGTPHHHLYDKLSINLSDLSAIRDTAWVINGSSMSASRRVK